MIRRALKKDIGRLAEIFVFAKRCAYRKIFQNDYVSFNEITVLNVAEELSQEGAIDNFFVYESDKVVKGLASFEVDGDSINFKELYIDPIFQNNIIGSRLGFHLIKYAKKNGFKSIYCWVLEGNNFARNMYEKFGLQNSGVKKEFANTGQYLLKYTFDL